MKGAPSRELTPFEKFNEAVKKVLSVPKATVVAREKALHEQRARARRKKRAVAAR